MPANLYAPALALAQGMQIGQILLLLFYLVLIFAGVYFITRFLGRVMQRGSIFPAKVNGQFRSAQHVKLVDRLNVDREKSILLLEAEGKRYLVGVSEHAFTLLETFDAPLPEEEDTAPRGHMSFRDMFSVWRKKEDDEHAPQE